MRMESDLVSIYEEIYAENNDSTGDTQMVINYNIFKRS